MPKTSAICHWLLALGFLVFAGSFAYSMAQSAPSPVREQLLNGLPVLYWQRPGDANVFLKLRLNSGAAFDLAGKAGTMALIGDALFPDPATREYVRDELGGRLEVTTTYDSIDVIISGKASELERIVELLRNAILSLNLSPESVTKLREARLAQLGKEPLSTSLMADRAVAARLFGPFPYGRPAQGDVDSLARVERADLMLAQERFFHSDNAALVVIGGVERARLMRDLRQMLGPWQKADRSVAQTFRQPNAPDARTLLINQPGKNNAEVRLAWRGLSRSDRDVVAASVLSQIARERWQAAVPELSSTRVGHEAHTLPGMFVFAASVPAATAQKALTAAQEVMNTLAQTGPSAAELERAVRTALAEAGKRSGELDLVADLWLDSEIYKTSLTANPANEISRLSTTDLQRVATRLVKDTTPAKIVMGDAEQLKSNINNIELPNTKPALKPDVKSTTAPQPPPKKP